MSSGRSSDLWIILAAAPSQHCCQWQIGSGRHHLQRRARPGFSPGSLFTPLGAPETFAGIFKSCGSFKAFADRHTLCNGGFNAGINYSRTLLSNFFSLPRAGLRNRSILLRRPVDFQFLCLNGCQGLGITNIINSAARGKIVYRFIKGILKN